MTSTFAGNTSESSSSHENRPCACFIASTISEPSRVNNGRHSGQPVAISTIVRFKMNDPATDVPPFATLSTSQNLAVGFPCH